MYNIIEVIILNGKFKGQHLLLTHIPMTPKDMPFEFKRLQFSIRLTFAMIIIKVQGHNTTSVWTEF
jgi:ATP-dependent DNA helicase PIF1